MTDRLSSQDVSFLYLEQPTTAMHAGSVMIFESPEGGLDVDRLTRFIESRIAYVPRYRQRVRAVPGRLANPVWVDDEAFDLANHVRRSALPRPGSDEQLAELVARLEARPLDRRRPLWEVYIVEGLEGGRFALVSKVHQALVDGVHTVDLAQVILEEQPAVGEPLDLTWQPEPGPSSAELVVGAVVDSVRRPGEVVDAVRNGLADVAETASVTARSLGRAAATLVRLANAPARSPLARVVTPHRRYAMVATDLDDYRTIRARVAEPAQPRSSEKASVTVNDVVLAVLAGALRAWLLARAEPVPPGSLVRTLAPMSVRAEGTDGVTSSGVPGTRVQSALVDLPTGEASPLIRLHQVAYQTTALPLRSRAVDAPTLAGLAGFAPPTLHSLGARVASGVSRRMFDLMVTNVPGPQQPLYVDRARMVATYPVVPLAAGQALSVGLTSYAGQVYYGLNADREALPDIDVLGSCIVDAIAELLEAVR